jgi:hypothetical protein
MPTPRAAAYLSLLTNPGVRLDTDDVALNAFLPVQNGRGGTFQPSRGLALAMLEAAIYDFSRWRGLELVNPLWAPVVRMGGNRDWWEAAGWLFERGQTRWPFSFENLCDHVGFEPDYIRSGLVKLLERLREVKPCDA